MIHFDALDLSEWRSEEVMFLLTLSVISCLHTSYTVAVLLVSCLNMSYITLFKTILLFWLKNTNLLLYGRAAALILSATYISISLK